MVQNKSGMTSNSLVDVAELIPDAVKYEASSMSKIVSTKPFKFKQYKSNSSRKKTKIYSISEDSQHVTA